MRDAGFFTAKELHLYRRQLVDFPEDSVHEYGEWGLSSALASYVVTLRRIFLYYSFTHQDLKEWGGPTLDFASRFDVIPMYSTYGGPPGLFAQPLPFAYTAPLSLEVLVYIVRALQPSPTLLANLAAVLALLLKNFYLHLLGTSKSKYPASRQVLKSFAAKVFQAVQEEQQATLSRTPANVLHPSELDALQANTELVRKKSKAVTEVSPFAVEVLEFGLRETESLAMFTADSLTSTRDVPLLVVSHLDSGRHKRGSKRRLVSLRLRALTVSLDKPRFSWSVDITVMLDLLAVEAPLALATPVRPLAAAESAFARLMALALEDQRSIESSSLSVSALSPVVPTASPSSLPVDALEMLRDQPLAEGLDSLQALQVDTLQFSDVEPLPVEELSPVPLDFADVEPLAMEDLALLPLEFLPLPLEPLPLSPLSLAPLPSLPLDTDAATEQPIAVEPLAVEPRPLDPFDVLLSSLEGLSPTQTAEAEEELALKRSLDDLDEPDRKRLRGK